MLPGPVRTFISQRIDDVEQLEIVMLLQRHADRSWSPSEVADALNISARRAAQQLESLGGRDLLDVRIGHDVRYRFTPATAELAAAARQLAECYRDRRADTVAFVGDRGPRSLRDFSDAFRLTSRKRNG